MNRKYFIVSPNEEVALHKKAFEESKINRLKKVREQEKIASTSLLNQTKNVNIEYVQDILKHLRIEFEGKQKYDINLLLKQLNNRLKTIGEGHIIADKENFGKMKELTVAERALITKRYKRAVSKILEEKAKEESSIAEQSKLRNKIFAMEENRKQAILLLPKPHPDPIVNLKPVKVNSSISKNQTVESFSLSYYNMQSSLPQAHYPDIFVEKVSDENQIDAKIAADEEEIKNKYILEKRMKENNERVEKAELRHKHALHEIQLKQQKEDLIEELDQLELKERLKKKNVVNKVPQYQRLQESKMKQMNLEQAFENAYNPTAGILLENKTLAKDDSSEGVDNDTLATSNQKENDVENLNEDSLPIPLSGLEKLRLHIRQQKKDHLKSLEVGNKVLSSNKNVFESSSSKNEETSSKMITTITTHHADSLRSMNISSACENCSSVFSTRAPSEDQSASSRERALSSERTSSDEKTTFRAKLSNEKLTSANINYTQHLLEHQQQVLKFQESLLKTQILNTALTSSCSSQVTSSSNSITQKLMQSSSKFSMSSEQTDDSSLKQYSLSKIDNHISSIGHHTTSQQAQNFIASGQNLILEKMTCEVQIQTSFIEVDGATQTSFNEGKTSLVEPSKSQVNIQDHITPNENNLHYQRDTSIHYPRDTYTETKVSSNLNDTVAEKIKNKKIALRQQYPELFLKNSVNPTDTNDHADSTDRVRNYKQHIKNQQLKLKFIRDSQKEKNKIEEIKESMNNDILKEKLELPPPTTFVQQLSPPTTFLDTNKTKQNNLSFSLDNNSSRTNNTKIDNIREEYKKLTQHLKQTNIDETNPEQFDKYSVNEFLLRQSNVDPLLWGDHFSNAKIPTALLDIPSTTNKSAFNKNATVNLTTNNFKLFDSSPLVSSHSIEKIDNKNQGENDFSLDEDQSNNFDSWIKKESFGENTILSQSSTSLSPSFQKVDNTPSYMLQNYSTNSSFHDFCYNNMPEYFKRVSEDPPFSPIYEVEEKTPFKEKNNYFAPSSSSSVVSLQEQFLSSPSATSQSSPTHLLHSLSANHIYKEPNFVDISKKLLSLKNDFNQLVRKDDFIQLSASKEDFVKLSAHKDDFIQPSASKDNLNQRSINKNDLHQKSCSKDNFNQQSVLKDDFYPQPVRKDNFNQQSEIQDDFQPQPVRKDAFNQQSEIHDNFYKGSASKDDFNQSSVRKISYSSYIDLRKNLQINNESIVEFFPLQPVQLSSLSYVENHILQSSTNTSDIVKINTEKRVNFEALSSSDLKGSPSKTYNSDFIKLVQPTQTSDGFEKFLQPAVIENSIEVSETSPKVKILTNDISSISSNGSPLFLPVTRSFEKDIKYSLDNCVSSSVDGSPYGSILKSKKKSSDFTQILQESSDFTQALQESSDFTQALQESSEFETKLLDDHKEKNEYEFSAAENKFHHLSPHINNSFNYKTPFFTTSNLNLFVHDSQNGSFAHNSQNGSFANNSQYGFFAHNSPQESFRNDSEYNSFAHDNQQYLFQSENPDYFLNLSLTHHEIENSQSNASLTHHQMENSQSNASLTHHQMENSQSNASLTHHQMENSQSNASLTHHQMENSQSNASLTRHQMENKLNISLQFNEVINNPIQKNNVLETQIKNDRYVNVIKDFPSENISSLFSKHFDDQNIIVNELDNRSNGSSQQDSKGNEIESNLHQYAGKNIMPYFEDITMDFTARKISGSSFSRTSINVEQDSFIPLPLPRKGITSDSLKNVLSIDPKKKDDNFQKNQISKDSIDEFAKDYFRDYSNEKRGHFNIETAKDKSIFLNESQLEISNTNDFTTELSVLSDLDLSIISGSVNWSSLAPFHDSGSSSQESLENIFNYHSQADLQEDTQGKNRRLQVLNQESLDESFYNQDGKADMPLNQDGSLIDEQTYHQEQNRKENNQINNNLKPVKEYKMLTSDKQVEQPSQIHKQAEHSSQMKLDSDFVKEKLFESKKRTKSLYERLPEVKQRNALKEKDEILKRNRAKMKEYHEKLQRNIKKRVKK